jgi:hypothetical protein
MGIIGSGSYTNGSSIQRMIHLGHERGLGMVLGSRAHLQACLDRRRIGAPS